MITGKNVVVVKSDDKKSYTATPYDRIYLEFGAVDKMIEVESKIGKESIKLADGSVFKKLVPAADISSTPVADLTQDAVNLLTEDAKDLADYLDKDGNLTPDAGWLLMLKWAGDGRDLKIRSDMQKNVRVKAIDPAAATLKVAESMVREAASKGKPITLAQAQARLAKLAALEAEEAAEAEAETAA